jgi:hypothetical protein
MLCIIQINIADESIQPNLKYNKISSINDSLKVSRGIHNKMTSEQKSNKRFTEIEIYTVSI